MRQRSTQPMKWAQPPWLRSAPTIPVSKRQTISSYRLFALLTFVTARVFDKKHGFLEAPLIILL